jgi:formylglycine-generating enzyme required for sulfatase activity
MERSESEEAAGARADAAMQADAVDHGRLARLVAARRKAAAGQSPGAAAAPTKKSKAPLVALLIVGAALLVGVTLSLLLRRSASSSADGSSNQSGFNPPQRQASPTPPVPTGGTAVEHEMIAIPGGSFQMGRDGGAPQEGPPHQVSVGPFYMDNTEVTNAEYAQFVRETGHEPPTHWDGREPPAGDEQLPVVNVSYRDAVEFAAWRSQRDHVKYRLPTEEEWEYAAKGGDQNNFYPWGNTWVTGYAGTKDSGAAATRPVGSYPVDKTRWGIMDMAGNVYEWTSSQASLYPGNDLEIDPAHKTWIVVRGGAYTTDHEEKPPSTYRDWFDPSRREPVIGFRLVRGVS